jgi:hypothetical protein
MKKEVWKPVVGYEGLYEISNTGRVKSFKSRITKILKPCMNNNKYLHIGLLLDKKMKTHRIHQLVAMAFLDHVPCGMKVVVDHINDNRLDNRAENLQIISHRDNVYKTQGKYTSQYKGVSKSKLSKKWKAEIRINGKIKHLGLFTDEHEAHLVYQEALSKLN